MNSRPNRNTAFNRLPRTRFMLVLLLAGFLLPGVARTQDRPDRTTGYFERLGFEYLTIDELHAQLARQPNANESRAIAIRLVDEYVRQFLDGGPLHPDFVWDAARMQRLADSWPDLTTPTWRLAQLAARLQATDRDYAAWQNHLTDNATGAQIARELELVLRSIENELDSMDVEDETGQGIIADIGLIRFRSTILLASVSMRLLSLGSETETASETAVRALQQILRLDSDPQISANQLDAMVPEFDWQIRALESLAICRLRNQSGDVGRIMLAIEGTGNPVDDRVAKIRVLAGARQFDAIDKLLAEHDLSTTAVPANATAQESRIWLAALQAGRQTPPELADIRSGIVWRAIRVIAMLDEPLLQQTLTDLYATEIPQPPDEFTKCWIEGARGMGTFLLHEQIDGSRLTNLLPRYLNSQGPVETVESRTDAVAALTEARRAMEPGFPLLGNSIRPDQHAAFLLTASEMDHQLGHWATAAEEAKTVLETKAVLRTGQVERAALLLLKSGVQLAAQDPARQLLLRQESLELANRFSDHPVGEMAKLQLMIVENRQRPAEQGVVFWQQYLQQFPENETAQVELLTRLLDAAGDQNNDRRQEMFLQAIAIARSLLGSETSSLATRVWAVSSLVNSVRGNGGIVPPGVAAGLLEQLDRLTANPEISVSERGEASFAVMRLGELGGNQRARNRAMAWIIDHPESGPWYAAALLERAKRLEEQFETAEPGSDDFESMLTTYSSLFDNAGSSADAIRRDPDIRLIASRLAQLHVRQGENKLAGELYDLILQAFPNDRDIMLAAARSNVVSGDYEKGSGRWQRLSQFFSAGSELWRESRYNLYACLLDSSPEDAESARKQTFELDPEMPEEWRRRY